MSKTIITFGEVMMRLSPPENRLLRQSRNLEFFFGGTEMNVAASLSIMGCDVKHVTNISDDFVGDAALSSMRSQGIDTRFVNRTEFPLGLYFLEVGSSIRASRISYNRLNGAFAHIRPEHVDWEKALDGADFFHWTGISPGISESAYQTLKEGLIVAKSKGIQITTDPTYRSNLWRYGKKGEEILKELVSYSTIFIGGVNEINEILGTGYNRDKEGFIEASKELIKEIPSIEKVFDKIRVGLNASTQSTYGQAWVNGTYLQTENLEVTPVVDRIGTGDAFAAGLIYGLLHYEDEMALKFANAACAIKHTILEDVNLCTADDILEIVNGKSGGRIKR